MRARSAVVVTLCMLAAATVSWARCLTAGSLATTGASWLIWPFAVVGVAGALAMREYLRAANDDEIPWSTLVYGAVAIHVAASLALPLTSNDVWSNIAYGRLAAHGDNPFFAGPAALPLADHVRALVEPQWAHVPMVYGPLIGGACWLTVQTGTLIGDLVLFKMLMLAAALTSVVLAAKLCRARYVGPDARARFVLFAWSPLFAWEVSGQAHNEGLLLVALLGFAWAALEERRITAILCLAAGVATKFVAAPIAGLYLVYIARKSPSRALALLGVLAGACALSIMPWWQGPETLAALWNHMAPSVPHTSRSIADLLYWVATPLGATAQSVVYQAVYLTGLLVSSAIGALGVWRARTPALVIHYALVFLLCSDVLALAWFQPWYVLWALPLALVHADRRWLRLTATYAALSLVAYVLPIDPISNVAVDLVIGWWIVTLLRSGSER